MHCNQLYGVLHQKVVPIFKQICLILVFMPSIFTVHDVQGVLLPDRQTLRGDSKHEDKDY